jgi:hypothetical protein
MHPPIIFLHIPKTAGQTVHDYLIRFFDTNDICPARENYQLCAYSLLTRTRFKLYSGHLDWSQVYGLHPNAFTFSILRKPIDRILSFYCYLRREAGKLSPEELNNPGRSGIKAILDLTPDEYFMGDGPQVRSFLDSLYDNVYTYYFAGRTYGSRDQFLAEVHAGRLTSDNILEIARDNIRKLSGLYRVEQLDKLQLDLANLGYSSDGVSLSETKLNVGDGDAASRIEELKALGLTDRGLERLNSMVELDIRLWSDNELFT